MHLTISDQQASLIVNILAQRPYAEVFELIAEIQAQAIQQRAGQVNPEPVQTVKTPRARRAKVTPIKANGHDTTAPAVA